MGKALIVYWTGSGNTEAMANAIAQGIQANGMSVDVEHVSAQPKISDYDFVAFGCPAMGAEVLEEGEFEPYFLSVEGELRHKKVALFGSYGWGSGEWMSDWENRTRNAGASLFQDQGLIINNAPDDAGLAECIAFGSAFAHY